MGVEQNKRTVRRVFEEGFSQGRLEVVDEALAPDAVDRHDFDDDAPDFRAHLKAAIGALRASFPDLHADVADLIGEGDRVAARVIMRGTHTAAPWAGVDASGREVEIEQFHFVQCDARARGIRHWANVALDDLARQVRAPA